MITIDNKVKERMKTIHVDDIINQNRLSRLQKQVLILSFLIFFCDGLDTGIIGFIAPALLDDWGISKPALAPVLSAALVGMSIGAIISGPISDRFGRKGTILVSTFLFALFSVLSGFATDTTQLMIYRLMTGLGLGAVMPNISTLVSEYMPANRKVFLTSIPGCGFLLGISSGGLISSVFLEMIGWRMIMVVCGILPLLLLMVLFFKLPESVRFLIKHNQLIAAQKILEKIQGSVIDLTRLANVVDTTSSQSIRPVQFLFRRHLKISVCLWLSCFMSLLVFYLFTSWMPTILKTSGLSTEQFSLIASVFPIGGAIGAAIIGWYMDKINPHRVIKSAYLIAFILFITASFIHSNLFLLSLTILLTGAMLAGAQAALLPLATISYPTECRAVGVSWMHGIGRLGAIFGAFTGSLIFQFSFSLGEILLILSVPTFIAFLGLNLQSDRHNNKAEIVT